MMQMAQFNISMPYTFCGVPFHCRTSTPYLNTAEIFYYKWNSIRNMPVIMRSHGFVCTVLHALAFVLCSLDAYRSVNRWNLIQLRYPIKLILCAAVHSLLFSHQYHENNSKKIIDNFNGFGCIHGIIHWISNVSAINEIIIIFQFSSTATNLRCAIEIRLPNLRCCDSARDACSWMNNCANRIKELIYHWYIRSHFPDSGFFERRSCPELANAWFIRL